MVSLPQTILATLAYSDIFQYPLNLAEIQKNLIGKKVRTSEISQELTKLIKDGRVGEKGQLFYLAGSKKFVSKRKSREKNFSQKLEKAKSAAKILKLVPSVKFIGISGATAVGNSDKNDDIDFFLICAQNRLWTTRFLATLVLDLFRLRRKPPSRDLKDKICLNMFLDEAKLEISSKTLYLAHEILQVFPLFDRDNTYNKFIRRNSWAFKFLPNWTKPKFTVDSSQFTIGNLFRFCLPSSNLFEAILKKIQLRYMAKRRTTEKISDSGLFFHPKDASPRVLKDFQNRLRKLKIPIDKAL